GYAAAQLQWGPARRPGRTSGTGRWTRPRRRFNGARPGGREGPVPADAARGRDVASMGPGPEAGKDTASIADRVTAFLLQWGPARRPGRTRAALAARLEQEELQWGPARRPGRTPYRV